MIWELTLLNIKLALNSLNRNRLRTALTMLGVIIGVAAVLTMVALGTGARGSVEQEVSSAGTNIVYVKSGNYTRGGDGVGILSGLGAADTLIEGDSDAIQGLSGIANVSPGNSVRTFISSNGARTFSRIQGISPSFGNIYSWNYVQGGAIESPTSESAILGTNLAVDLFGSEVNPIGQVVQLRDINYTVIGVTDDSADDHSEVMFVPWRTLQNSLDKTNLDSITISVQRAGEASSIAEEIRALLRQRHGLVDSNNSEVRTGYLTQQGGVGGVPDDFTVETQAAEVLTKGLYTPAAAFALANLPKLDQVTLEEMTDTLDRASGTMTALLASIAGASLFVGGIGIMNIMLVSVSSRTREIGLRMALGATLWDVLTQFLVESLTLAMLGGLLGLAIGFLALYTANGWLGWAIAFSPAMFFVAALSSALVGSVFGFVPARRAALLDPVLSLRSE